MNRRRDGGDIMERPFDSYKFLLEHVADWDLLAELAEHVHNDRRLSKLERMYLYALVDARDGALRGTTTRALRGSIPAMSLPNT